MTADNAKTPDENFCESCEKSVETEVEFCPHCGEEQSTPSNPAVGPMVGNGLSGLFNVMGIGHMASGHVGRGFRFMISGWALFIIAWALWLGGGVADLFFDVLFVRIITGLLTLLTFPAYIGIWIWSIVDIKNIVAGKNETTNQNQV